MRPHTIHLKFYAQTSKDFEDALNRGILGSTRKNNIAINLKAVALVEELIEKIADEIGIPNDRYWTVSLQLKANDGKLADLTDVIVDCFTLENRFKTKSVIKKEA